MAMDFKRGLPSVIGAGTRLLILGSLPGDASLAERRYYAHPSNQFWRLLGLAIGADLAPLDYEERLAVLAEHRVGLWDVIEIARRDGSLDQSIRDARHNDLESLVDRLPELRAVAFNGATSARAGRKQLEGRTELTLVDLPSSSAANTQSFSAKAERWSELAKFLRD